MSHVKPIEELFEELIGLSDAKERQDFLDRVCGDDSKLRQQLEALANSHEQAGSFLRDDSLDETQDFGRQPTVGQSIGPYKLRELIGEGGMGSVYVAEQERPLRRKVALKVIKPGMDTKEVVARFEAERQALAMMDHPCIAKVFDAGMTDNGRPYFVMELINGVPITEYCDDNKLGVRERLELFVQVCKAVQHAHQKGVIHRDIKPSNVLVTLHDSNPVPVIIDFGVVKATNQSLTDQTIYTRLNQMVGTTLYMSPEQAELSRYGVDTRTDVYSLGVLLYELLTGTTPFDRDRLSTAAFDEVRRIIREEEPSRPSTRISSLGKTATDVSVHRSTEPIKLFSTIRGDLDWIVMKALEKDRNRRYDSATSFSDDVENYLSDQVVEARPPSTVYQIRKVLKRNRALFSTISGVFFALVMGLGFALSAIQAKNRILAKLKEEIAGDAFDQALIGNLGPMEHALDRAKEAGVDPALLHTIRGLGHLYSGDAEAGMNELDAVTRESPNSVFAWSGLWLASLHVGQYERMSEARLRITDLEKSNIETELPGIERLFLAQINRHRYPESTVNDLTMLLEHHPSWGAAYALRGRARINVAKDNYEAHDALDKFKDALLDFHKAAIITDESEFVTADYLLALLEACEFGRYLGINEQCDVWMQQADAIFNAIDKIDRRGGYLLKARTAYLAATHREAELHSRWDEIVRDPNGSSILKAAHYLTTNQIESFETLVKGLPADATDKKFLLRILQQAADPEKKVSLELYPDLIRDQEYATDISLFAMDAFLLADEYQQARTEAASLLSKSDLSSGRWNRKLLQFYSDQSSDAETELLDRAGPFVREQSWAIYSIGMLALAKGERENAAECFSKVLECAFLDHWHYCMSYVLTNRLKSSGRTRGSDEASAAKIDEVSRE